MNRCGHEGSGTVIGKGESRRGGLTDQPWLQLEPQPSFRRSRGPSTPDSFGERSESCDGSPQPLAVESIAKTSARLELIILQLLFLLPAQYTAQQSQCRRPEQEAGPPGAEVGWQAAGRWAGGPTVDGFV